MTAEYVSYQVRRGDCLWDIAQTHFGHAWLWPSIYTFNNWAASRNIPHATAIVDPNLIKPHEWLLLPAVDELATLSTVERKSIAAMVDRADAHARNGRNPARFVDLRPFWAFSYTIFDQSATFDDPAFTAVVDVSGTFHLKPANSASLLTVGGNGLTLSKTFFAEQVFGNLTAVAGVEWKAGQKPKLNCALTGFIRGGPEFDFTPSRDGFDFEMKQRAIQGSYQGFDFNAVCKIDITIKAKPGGGTGNLQQTSISFQSAKPHPMTYNLLQQHRLTFPTRGNKVAKAKPKAGSSNHNGVKRGTDRKTAEFVALSGSIFTAAAFAARQTMQFVEQFPPP